MNKVILCKTCILIFTLLQLEAIEMLELAEDTFRSISFQFNDKNDIVSIEEPNFEEEIYSSMRCNILDKQKSLSCLVRSNYHVRDNVWYDKNCSFDLSIQNSDETAKIKNVRFNSVSYDVKIISFTTYDDDTTKQATSLELNRVTMSDCTTMELNKVINVTDREYEIIPYDGTSNFDLIFKSSRSFEDQAPFKILMNAELQCLSDAAIKYIYEQPRNYDFFNVHPVNTENTSEGYYFLYNFANEATLYSANSYGQIKRGKAIFNQHQNGYKDVRSVQGQNMILVCGYLMTSKIMNRSCTFLDESISRKWHVNEMIESIHEHMIGARILKSHYVILAYVITDSEYGSRTLRFDGVTPFGGFKHLFNFNETLCNETLHVQFGTIYETEEEICFSTYCKQSIEHPNTIKKWNARCLDKILLADLAMLVDKGSANKFFATSEALLFLLLTLQSILYSQFWI